MRMKLDLVVVRIMPLLLWVLVSASNNVFASTGGVFRVQHTFAGKNRSLIAIKDHDSHRHQRLLYAINIPLNKILSNHLTPFYTTVKIGSPLTEHYVHIDTVSNQFWVNCVQCIGCPEKSGLGIDLTPYNPRNSSTSREITCEQDVCTLYNKDNPVLGCTRGARCNYKYEGENYLTSGYLVEDTIQYDRVSGDFETKPATSSVILGCAFQNRKKKDGLELDGLLGFGRSNLSMLTQIAATREIKNKFSHCLSDIDGIFAIGDVLQPNLKTTSMISNDTRYYNINLIKFIVGEKTLQLPKSVRNTTNAIETIIDIGTTLSYIPEELLYLLMEEIFKKYDGEEMRVDGDSICFGLNKRLEDVFPNITIIFQDSLKLEVSPYDYLFSVKKDNYCIVWQPSPNSKDGKEVAILGTTLLKNKLVSYDLENNSIGWTDYNCSSSINVQDEQSKSIYQMDQNVSSAHNQKIGNIIILLLLSHWFCHHFFSIWNHIYR